jgi:hypothetical protein
LHLARGDCRSLQQVVVERAIAGSMPYTTVARRLAAASLQPHRSRYWKTATIDERFGTQTAKILWRYERGEWLYDRGEVVLCVDEKPPMQVLVLRVATQAMSRKQSARREFEYKRNGPLTFFVALNVYDGSMWGCCLEANDHEPFLSALSRLTRHYHWARRLTLVMDHGSSPIAHHTKASLASPPRGRACYTPPHASWLNQAEMRLRACSDTYLQRVDPDSRQPLIDHLEASWPEYNRRFAHPCQLSWRCRDLYAWARKKATLLCSKTFATVHLVVLFQS